jgi:hypothetical protein
MKTSTLPLSEGDILCHDKSFMEVLELCPGKRFGKKLATSSFLGRYGTHDAFLCTMSRM